jgi:hypothetical protein
MRTLIRGKIEILFNNYRILIKTINNVNRRKYRAQ